MGAFYKDERWILWYYMKMWYFTVTVCEIKQFWWEGYEAGCRALTSLASLLVLRLCCMDRDSAMSVTGLWIFFRSPLYFTCMIDICKNAPWYETLSMWYVTGKILFIILFFKIEAPRLPDHWRPSESDKSCCSSNHTVVSFLSSPCQTSPCTSAFERGQWHC